MSNSNCSNSSNAVFTVNKLSNICVMFDVLTFRTIRLFLQTTYSRHTGILQNDNTQTFCLQTVLFFITKRLIENQSTLDECRSVDCKQEETKQRLLSRKLFNALRKSVCMFTEIYV